MNSFRPDSADKVLVIGAGMGGLACAIDLACAGFAVTVLERAAAPGGKMREVALGGVKVDSGPTVLTMRWVFDALFADAGARLEDRITLHPLDVLARHAWCENQRLDLFADLDRSADAIGVFAGAAEAKGYRAFSAEAKTVFETLRDTFLTKDQTNPIGLAGRVGIGAAPALFGLRPFDTLWSALGDHFRDARLRQLFGRYATYCGSSPFAAPATLMLIAHVEQEGVWTVEGGMQRLAEALENLARSLGVEFVYDAQVERVTLRHSRASGVLLDTGQPIESDFLVSNADAGALDGDLARSGPRPSRAARSLSAVTWTLDSETEGFPLERHNVFFSDDYRAEFDDIFNHRRLPRTPTIYVCAQDRGGEDSAQGGSERLLVLINAPADGDVSNLEESELMRCETQVFDHLKRCGLTVRRTANATVTTTPSAFNALFPHTGGALYGQATHGWAAAFQRPGAKTRIPGLYQAGGGAHPGAGVPMAVLSGRLAAARLMRDRASMSPFRRAAISGGMSTP